MYNIDKKTYHYNIEAKVPIGKTFRLRYLPENPEQIVLINPYEFKNYPKSYWVKRITDLQSVCCEAKSIKQESSLSYTCFAKAREREIP